jgi:hypothetical protein
MISTKPQPEDNTQAKPNRNKKRLFVVASLVSIVLLGLVVYGATRRAEGAEEVTQTDPNTPGEVIKVEGGEIESAQEPAKQEHDKTPGDPSQAMTGPPTGLLARITVFIKTRSPLVKIAIAAVAVISIVAVGVGAWQLV